MQNITIERPEVPCMYWSKLNDGIIRFHLNTPSEKIPTIHRTGSNERVITAEELAIEGICWESLLLTIYALTDADTTKKMDALGRIYGDFYHDLLSYFYRSSLSKEG